MIDLIEHGMHTVGMNLRLIRENNFEGLIEIIRERSEKRFGHVSGYLDDKALRIILKNAAESLEESSFFYWRIQDARDIYLHLGDPKKAEVLNKIIQKYEEIPTKQFNNTFNFY